MNEAIIAAVVAAICDVESGGKIVVNIHDGGSASYGECQVKLNTARQMGFRGTVTELWFNSRVNRHYAEKYFRYQLGRYGDLEHAIAAYNSGSVVKGNIRNMRYVHRVMGRLQ